MKNPLDAIKRLWHDKKKRPWILGGAGAAGAAAFYTLRSPAPGPELAAEETAATMPGNITSSDPALEDPYAGDVYVGGGPVDWEPAADEMDFSPLFDAMDQADAAIAEEVAAEIGAERDQRRRQVKGLKTQLEKSRKKADLTAKRLKAERQANRRQDNRLDRQRKSLRQQRQALARARGRVKQGPKRKRRAKART